MKSGLALMIDLLEHDPEVTAGLDLTLIFYAREEAVPRERARPSARGRPRARRLDLASVPRAERQQAQPRGVGLDPRRAAFRGRTAHSARPWQGENAIHKAGPLTDLAALAPREALIDGLLYRSVTSATLAKGGRGRNIVPDLFEVNLNHRFSPTSRSRTRSAGSRPWSPIAPASSGPTSAPRRPLRHPPLVAALREAGVAAVEPKQAWTDVARFAARSTPP